MSRLSAAAVSVVFDPDEIGRSFGEEPPPTMAPLPRPVDPVRETAASRRIYRLSELAELKGAAEDAIIGGGLMTRGAKLLLHASSGAGKTTVMDHLTASLASGRPFLGRFRIDRPRRVLVIQAELAKSELASHGHALLASFDGTSAAENLIFWLETQLRLPRGYAELRAVVRETGPRSSRSTRSSSSSRASRATSPSRWARSSARSTSSCATNPSRASSSPTTAT